MSIFVYGILGFMLSIVLALLPASLLKMITPLFGFGKYGIRNIKRKRDVSDSLANLFLFISVIFAFVYWIIPFHTVIFVLFYVFSYLCLLAQAGRVATRSTRFLLLFSINMMFFFGLFASLGFFNDGFYILQANTFRIDFFGGNVSDLFYWLHNCQPMGSLFQGLIYLTSLYCLWAQFKYMRLENTFKSVNIYLFLIKVIGICAVFVIFSIYGQTLLEWVYYLNYKEAVV